jgi:hypothetical protein
MATFMPASNVHQSAFGATTFTLRYTSSTVLPSDFNTVAPDLGELSSTQPSALGSNLN